MTVLREPWPPEIQWHWHIVDTFVSRHVVTAIEATYGPDVRVTELTFDDYIDCPECGVTIGGSNG